MPLVEIRGKQIDPAAHATWINVRQAIEISGRSHRTIYYWIKRGYLETKPAPAGFQGQLILRDTLITIALTADARERDR